MKEHWKSTTIGAISEVVTKGTTPTSIGFKFTENGVNFVKVETITKNGQFLSSKFGYIDENCHQSLKRSQLVSGDILFSIAGALGRTARVTHEILPANTNQALAIIRLKPSHEVMPEFILRALSSGMLMEQIEKQRGGVAQQNLSLAQVKNFQVPLPPFSEQKRIVAILNKVFEGIDRAIALAEKNLANARELFESYLNAIFTKKADRWEWVKLSEITTDITDGDHQPPPKSESGIPFITISNIDKQNRKVDFSNTFKVLPEYFEKLKVNRKPRKGDLLYTVTGSYGIPVIIEHDRNFCFQRHIGLIRPNDETNSKCLYYILLSRYLLDQADECATGTAQKTVSLSGLRRFSVPKIPKEEQQLIVAKLDIISEKVSHLEAIYRQKIAALKELKQSILQKAFTGELTADTVEKAA